VLWESRQELAINVSLVGHAQCLASVSFLVHGDEHGELLVCVASKKLFHLLQPPFQGFAEVYAKPRCSAFIASISALVRSRRDATSQKLAAACEGRFGTLSGLPTSRQSRKLDRERIRPVVRRLFLRTWTGTGISTVPSCFLRHARLAPWP